MPKTTTPKAPEYPCKWCNTEPSLYSVRELNKDGTVTVTEGCAKCTSERNYVNKLTFPFVIAFNRILVR
jgi:hypothetical protein